MVWRKSILNLLSFKVDQILRPIELVLVTLIIESLLTSYITLAQHSFARTLNSYATRSRKCLGCYFLVKSDLVVCININLRLE